MSWREEMRACLTPDFSIRVEAGLREAQVVVTVPVGWWGFSRNVHVWHFEAVAELWLRCPGQLCGMGGRPGAIAKAGHAVCWDGGGTGRY